MQKRNTINVFDIIGSDNEEMPLIHKKKVKEEDSDSTMDKLEN